MEGRKKLTEGKDRPKLKGEKVEHSEHTKKRKHSTMLSFMILYMIIN